MVTHKTNLVVLRPSRSKIKKGQIFRMQLPDGSYLFGRVIDADMPRERAPMPSSNLIYIYKFRSTNATPDIKMLSPDNLLLPPIFTNQMGWAIGVFETIMEQEITAGDILMQHCFWSVITETFVNENEIPIQQPDSLDFCGEWALESYRWIDDKISNALGIPLVE